MMLSKLTISTTSINLNLSNYKRKRPTSFVSNIGPLIQRIKNSLNHNNNLSTAQKSNTAHCCLNDYQEMSEKNALSASSMISTEEEQENNIKLSWSQETFLYALAVESENSKNYVQHVENWWSTTPSIQPPSTNAIMAC
ncbi:hypothetical protein INT46_009446 [Mucor plumbeus]|uniref:Uncharacterized protein n=1 Tax=Mucor plumbeus TaxID=97098 RepID=A0A8H7RJC1_9FUNG|nr:hypothetical protein INT46_009446 [Mucor plumbeus]